MKNDTSLFTSKIISAERFRELKKYRYGMYFLLLLLAAARITPTSLTHVGESLIEILEIDKGLYVLTLAIVLVSTGVLYLYSKEWEILGEVRINESGFTLDKDGFLKTYIFTELTGVIIERKSTYHYEYKDKNYLVEINNWLYYTKDNEQYKVEFLIDSMKQNEAFEKMIATLRARRVKFKYLSI